MSEAAEASFDDVQMSRDGMRFLLCNDWKAAEDLFDKYKYVLIFLKDERTLIGSVELWNFRSRVLSLPGAKFP